MEDTSKKIRNALCKFYLRLDKSHDVTGIFEDVDSFVELSQGNTGVQLVDISPNDEDAGNYELWDKVGRGVGNLKSLNRLAICPSNYNDWEILTRILRHIRHNIMLVIYSGHIRGTEDMRAFVAAIQGHPAITSVDTRGSFRFELTGILCSALATLPNLEDVTLWHLPLGREEVPELGRPESVTELLRAPFLRSVEFYYSSFTNALCEATANALKEGAAITSLKFHRCSFTEGGREKIVSALMRNATLTPFLINSDNIKEAFCDAMAASLLSNSTLQELTILNTGGIKPSGVAVSSLFLALGLNTTLKRLVVTGFDFAGELCPALQDGLGKNSTLERLELIEIGLVEAGVSAFSFYFAAVKAVQPNKTLKSLRLGYYSLEMADDEVKDIAALVNQNYGLESLENNSSDERMGDVLAILRLNRAGPRYLNDDGSSIVKGVDVLSVVSNNLNCVFLHLLENPLLCNRDAN
jgi:hypothetical protein